MSSHPAAKETGRVAGNRMDLPGQAAANGGHVFVLDARPWHRVAHLHVVEHGSEQWRNCLLLRDLLRRSSDARARYESVKRQLANDLRADRKAYADGKSGIVGMLLTDLA